MSTFLKQHVQACLEDFRRACKEGKPLSERQMYLARLDAALYHMSRDVEVHCNMIEYGEG